MLDTSVSTLLSEGNFDLPTLMLTLVPVRFDLMLFCI